MVKPCPASATSIPGMLFWAQWVGQIVKGMHPQVSLMTSCCSGSELFALPQLYSKLFCKEDQNCSRNQDTVAERVGCSDVRDL